MFTYLIIYNLDETIDQNEFFQIINSFGEVRYEEDFYNTVFVRTNWLPFQMREALKEKMYDTERVFICLLPQWNMMDGVYRQDLADFIG